MKLLVHAPPMLTITVPDALVLLLNLPATVIATLLLVTVCAALNRPLELTLLADIAVMRTGSVFVIASTFGGQPSGNAPLVAKPVTRSALPFFVTLKATLVLEIFPFQLPVFGEEVPARAAALTRAKASVVSRRVANAFIVPDARRIPRPRAPLHGPGVNRPGGSFSQPARPPALASPPRPKA